MQFYHVWLAARGTSLSPAMQKTPTILALEGRIKRSYLASQAGVVQDERSAGAQKGKKQVRTLVVQVPKQIYSLAWLRKNRNQTKSSCTSKAWPAGACLACASQAAAEGKPIAP